MLVGSNTWCCQQLVQGPLLLRAVGLKINTCKETEDCTFQTGNRKLQNLAAVQCAAVRLQGTTVKRSLNYSGLGFSTMVHRRQEENGKRLTFQLLFESIKYFAFKYTYGQFF